MEEHIFKKLDKIIGFLKRGEIKSGDIVYCSKFQEDVIFIDAPDSKSFNKYEIDKKKVLHPPFVGKARVQRLKGGKIYQVPVSTISKIQLGEVFVDIYPSNKGHLPIQFVYQAREYGFRIEYIKDKRGYVMRIYGDSIIGINSFIQNYSL